MTKISMYIDEKLGFTSEYPFYNEEYDCISAIQSYNGRLVVWNSQVPFIEGKERVYQNIKEATQALYNSSPSYKRDEIKDFAEKRNIELE